MTPIINLLTSPTSSNYVQNSFFQVVSEGSLKAIGRPTFTLLDKSATPETRKYAATREFLYQTLCIATYFAIFVPIFKKGGYKFLKKNMFKNDPIFQAPNVKEFYKRVEKAKEANKDVAIQKGAMEAVSILGSAITLTMVAPAIVNKIIHPVMNKLFPKNNKQK